MKKILAYAAVAAAMMMTNQEAGAQMPYQVSTFNETYVPLTNATNLTSNRFWSDTTDLTVPVGFNFQMGGGSINKFIFSQSNLLLPALTGTQSGFAFMGTGLQDRNFASGMPASPVQYTVSGNNGSRIFKLELKNAGFTTEKEMYGTSQDSVNVQVWIYESNSSIEFRFGPSLVQHFSDYFDEKMPLGYMKGLDMTTFDFQKFYCLKGLPANPGMDTLTDLDHPSGFDAYPANGTVYRFTLKTGTTAVTNKEKTSLGKVYPIPAFDQLTVESQADAYEILSMSGQLLEKGNITQQRQQVSLQHIPTGMYLLRLSNRNAATDVQKFIKQ